MTSPEDPDADEDFGFKNTPFSMDYALALERSKSRLTPLQVDLLSALVVAERNELSGGQIARLLGLPHHGPVNLTIARLAKTLTAAVGVEPPKRSNGTSRWWHVVAEGRQAPDGARFIWRLRPALRDAAVAAGIGIPAEMAFPEEKDEGPLFEGALKTVLVNAYERNPVARRRCIEHHGTHCAVCGLTLASVYGPIAEGVIHVHHLRQLSDCGGEDYQVDPIAELRPVCPNCHVVLHLRRPPVSIEELRAIVAERRQDD